MEESKSSKNGNDETRKPACVICEESKAVRVTANQNLKGRSDKSVKDVGRSSPNGNSSKKNKPNDLCSERAEAKLCKVSVSNVLTDSKILESVLQDQGHSKVKKIPNPPVVGENMQPIKAEQTGEIFPSSPTPGTSGCKETLPKGKSTLENVPGPHKLKANTDNSGNSSNSVSGSEDQSDELSKIKSAEPPKEHLSEIDYLENATVIDESALTAEQQLGLKQAEERLERDYIFRLEKRSPEYTNCRYLCKLCLVHIENIQGAHKHIKEKRHKKNIMEKQEENELRALPPPFPAQLAALSFTLIEAAKEQGISDDDFRVREDIVNEMEKIVQRSLPDCSLRMYGSSLTKFAFQNSDVNIDVKFPSKMSHPDVLIQVLDILKHSALYSDVESDFHAKVPVVFCKDVKSGLTCKVSAGNDVACLTADLLAALGKLEPVLRPLVLAFRYWARMCHIDCQAEGGIPSYSFALMVIFFLQQRKPPILPSYLGTWIEGFDSKKVDDHQLKGIEEEKFVRWEYKPSNCTPGKNSNEAEDRAKAEQPKEGTKKATDSEPDNQSNATQETHGRSPLSLETPHQVSLGQLWLDLLKFYTLEFALEEYVISVRVQELLTRESKNWPKRRIAIEDPFALKRNVARSLNSQMVFEYILERFRTAYRYFACPQSKDGRRSKTDTKKKEKGKISNRKSVKPGDGVANCCLQQGENLEKPNAESGCGAPAGEVEDRSEMESVSGRGLAEDSDSSLATTSRAADPSHHDDGDGGRQEAVSPCTTEGYELEQRSLDEPEAAESSGTGLKDELLRLQCTCRPSSLDSNATSGRTGTERPLDSEPECSRKRRDADASTTSHNCKAAAGVCDLKDEGTLSPQEMHYVFDQFILTSGKPPTIVCSICKRDGHSKNDCPEDFKKIDLKPLPPLTNRFREILDLVCKKCFDELSPPLSEHQNREQILASLERFIRKEYNDKARLCLFGSSKNGFGFRDSDLDICMTLEGHENAEKLNCKDIIESLAKILRKHPGLRNILPITTAKVPIVKFEHRRSGLEGDISLYNTLAQHNTRMLATYAALDPRVQYLGYTMKVFAKRCDIGDASRGSLSSYAYILMVLYFLQQRNPPVIPVLQEIFDGKQIPQRMVDGWNAFFFDDAEELKKRLPALAKNTESLGELWLGLLRFYTEEFDFKEYVISIRQKKLLTTFEKQWTSKCIAIEDPFDLNHNLGAGVSRKMTNFIMKAFINGRKLFGTPFYPHIGREAASCQGYFSLRGQRARPHFLGPSEVSGLWSRHAVRPQEYFFDSKVLTDGELAPNDRCCRVCGKIGHYMKDCPKRRRVKKKESEKDDEKEAKEEEREPREKRCFICGDVGHVRRDCPEFKQTRQRNSSVAAAQLVRSLVSVQPAAGQAQPPGDRPLRTRQTSECSDSHQSSYSPQPQPFSQTGAQPGAGPQSAAPAGPPPKHVPPPPGAQPPQLQLRGPSWPIHGPVLHSAPNNPPPPPASVPFSVQTGGAAAAGSQTSVGLNDPSIIFAQPAARPLAGVPSSSHEGHWRGPGAPSVLGTNGPAATNSDQGFAGQFGKLNAAVPWESGTSAHFPLLQASWPFGLPPSFIQQGGAGFQPNKPFYPQAGPLVQGGQRFPLLSPGPPHPAPPAAPPPHLNVGFLQQKK
ncbi:terminal uridylyltransferase 4 isoform X2 [Ornithorhynchus anatinus]|uniref:terminal uridylyltransferase 4 isoform X2 n=1 Tax=Ornithorhynchus anatinus TaxID=9258 RepID=UPI0010A8F32B|nr:terminal uridylyltransferase 4 isoform X2 [Ornithorhynchus anatinus]